MPEQPLPELSDEDVRRCWRLRWLSALRTFGDVEMQRSRWLDPTEENPYFSFVECMCGYFDDAYLGEESAYRRRIERSQISEVEVDAVADFHALAAAYRSPGGGDWDVAAIVDDPAWHAVVASAQEAQRMLLELIEDPAEIAALTRPPEWTRDGSAYRSDDIGATYVPAGRENASPQAPRLTARRWLSMLFGRKRGSPG